MRDIIISFTEKNPYRSAPILVPELAEVFRTFPSAKLLLDIHTNNPKVVDALINLIDKEFKNGDFIIVSAYDDIIIKIKRKKPKWTFGVPQNEAKKMLYSSFLFLDSFFPIKSDILMLPKQYGKINVLTSQVLKHASKRNKPIWAWMYEGDHVKTVETKSEMESLHKIGVQGIFTEFPEKLFQQIKH